MLAVGCSTIAAACSASPPARVQPMPTTAAGAHLAWQGGVCTFDVEVGDHGVPVLHVGPLACKAGRSGCLGRWG